MRACKAPTRQVDGVVAKLHVAEVVLVVPSIKLTRAFQLPVPALLGATTQTVAFVLYVALNVRTNVPLRVVSRPLCGKE